MRPLKIYIETSVFGFLLDELEHNRNKRKFTDLFFKQIEAGNHEPYISDAVIAELLASPDKSTRNKLLKTASQYPSLPQPDPQELRFLVDLFMNKRAFPAEKRDDAVHVALVILNPRIDAMVSWNCHHLANENNRRYLKSLAITAGYAFGFDIVTPEEMIIYENT